MTESLLRPAVPRLSPPIRHSGERPSIAEPLVSFLAPDSFVADQYRSLRHIVERMHADSGFQILAMTSPGAGEGKTVTTINLAGALAQSREARVLLIDADLRRPAVNEYLGLPGEHSAGLADALEDPECGLATVVRHLDWANLSVLPAGNARAEFYELLSSPRLEALLGEARRQYDYVLVDTPPIVPVPDGRLIGRWVDGFFMVVAANQTPRRPLAEALNLLDPSKVVGIVFNGATQAGSRDYGYYGQYGTGYSRATNARSGWWQRARTAASSVRRPLRPR